MSKNIDLTNWLEDYLLMFIKQHGPVSKEFFMSLCELIGSKDYIEWDILIKCRAHDLVFRRLIGKKLIRKINKDSNLFMYIGEDNTCLKS